MNAIPEALQVPEYRDGAWTIDLDPVSIQSLIIAPDVQYTVRNRWRTIEGGARPCRFEERLSRDCSNQE